MEVKFTKNMDSTGNWFKRYLCDSLRRNLGAFSIVIRTKVKLSLKPMHYFSPVEISIWFLWDGIP